jgi:predicted secreted protein
MSIRIVAIVAGLLALAGAAASEELERSETWKKANVEAPFEIALITNPSTGYGWQIDKAASSGLDSIDIEDLGTSPQPQSNGQPLIGAPVIRSWLVTAHKPGNAQLVLSYARPPEPPEKTHVFHFEISE